MIPTTQVRTLTTGSAGAVLAGGAVAAGAGAGAGVRAASCPPPGAPGAAPDGWGAATTLGPSGRVGPGEGMGGRGAVVEERSAPARGSSTPGTGPPEGGRSAAGDLMLRSDMQARTTTTRATTTKYSGRRRR